MTSRKLFTFSTALAAAFVFTGCGQQNSGVVEERTVSGDQSTTSSGDTAERMGMGDGNMQGELPPGHPPIDGSTGAPGTAMTNDATAFSYELPEGWQEAPPAPMRDVNLTVGPQGEAECYVTVLPGGGGGLDANINRWRGQMNLEPYTAEEIDQLRRIPLLGGEAALVDFTGAYSGMGDEVQTAQARLIGAILEDDSTGIFVKLVGPTEVLEGEKEKFVNFCDSLARQESAAAAPTSDPHAGLNMGGGNMQSPGGQTTPDAFTWLAPDGWNRAADRSMRVVTYTMGDSGKTECYLTTLSGPAGGVEANINRWRNQMGKQPLSSSEISALPDVTVMGEAAKMVEINGDFTDMAGQTTQGAALIGLIRELPNQTLFVKMTGPTDEVQANKEKFIQFCESLAREDTSGGPVI